MTIVVRGEVYDITDETELRGYSYLYYVEDDNQNQLGYYDSFMFTGIMMTEGEAEFALQEEVNKIKSTGIVPNKAAMWGEYEPKTA